MTERLAAEVFPPGEFIQDELDARGWAQADLAEIMGRPPRVINEIIGGKRGISPETAQGLGDAFGTGAQFWMNMEAAYQLSKISSDERVVRRAALFAKVPLKEMLRRHWIESSGNLDVIEKQVKTFFQLKSIEDPLPSLAHAARKSADYCEVSPAMCAWMLRVRQLASKLKPARFSEHGLEACFVELKQLMANPEGSRHVQRVLLEAGIRFVVVEPLSGTKVDGACMWLNKSSPVIAVSLRFDRIDAFWFTLWHELGHVKNGDGIDTAIYDTELVGEGAKNSADKPPRELAADEFSSESCINQPELQSFIERVHPLYSKLKITGFAAKLGVHPGIVVGQLQHRRKIPYSYHREMLARMRTIVTETTLTDGWGHILPTEI
jgi:HTH-type transcriptional regulator / antitoxin HigA